MSLVNLTVAQLKAALNLLREKEELQLKLDAVARKLDALAGTPRVGGRGRPADSSSRAHRKLKPAILKLMKEAGRKGLSVGDLASTLKVPTAGIFSWFYTTGKKIPAIKKVGVARYALI